MSHDTYRLEKILSESNFFFFLAALIASQHLLSVSCGHYRLLEVETMSPKRNVCFDKMNLHPPFGACQARSTEGESINNAFQTHLYAFVSSCTCYL